jgi:hypothetical protein
MLEFVLEKRRMLEEALHHSVPTPNRALIDVSVIDLAGIAALSGYLEQKDVQPLAWPHATAARPQVRMASLVESLRTAKYFIVICGPRTGELGEARAQEAWKACIENDLKARVGLYVLPGARPPARGERKAPPYAVIDNSGGFDPKPLDSYLVGP